MQIKDKVYGIYNEWIDHPHNHFVKHDYSGTIVQISEKTIIVKTKNSNLGTIEISTKEGDTINIK